MAHRRIEAYALRGALIACLALAGCNKTPQASQPVTGAPVAALPLATASPPPPSYAPAASALPPAPQPVAYRPSPEHWRYLTDAYDMSDAFADTPPDYTVAYDGEDPYIWRADDGAYRVVEWVPGGARYYYYEPGADEPFLIQDPEYSYAYDNGALVAVYTIAGALVADRIAAERRDYAARYYLRGHDLYHAAVNDQRRAAYAATWNERAPMIRQQRERWQSGREAQPGWRDWSRAHQPQQEARWAQERQHRATYAAALAAAPATHRPDRAPHPAEAQPMPAHPDHQPAIVRNDHHADPAERQAEADRAHPGLLQTANPAPQAHDMHRAMADRHGANPKPNPIAPQAARPVLPGVHGPVQRVEARHEIAQAQHAQQQQAAQQRGQMQHAAMAQRQQPQIHAEIHAAAPRIETPHVQMPQHVEAPHAAPAPHVEAPHPAAQQSHGGGNGGGQGDRHHR